MTILTAKVTSVKFVTIPSGQIKPRVFVISNDDGKERVIPFNNFTKIYDNVIIAGTELEFKDKYQCRSLIQAKPPTTDYEKMRTLLLNLVKECSICNHATSQYKSNYWCTNIECSASRNNRLQLILKYSPILSVYNKRKLVTYLKTNLVVSVLEFLDPNNLNKYLLSLGERRVIREIQNIEKIKHFYIEKLRNWSTIDKLCCLDARIKHPIAKILSQDGRVTLNIINKYLPKDIIDLGVKRLEAVKIHQQLHLKYNKKVISEIMRVEEIVGEHQDGYEN